MRSSLRSSRKARSPSSTDMKIVSASAVLPLVGRISATMPVTPWRRLRPDWLGEYPSASAAASTRCRVSSLTSLRPLSARETVPIEAVIHTLGPEEYLPRVDWLGFAREQTMNWDELGAGYPLDPGPEAKTGVPDYVVLSDKSWPRRADAERPILDRLLSGEAGYAVVFDQERRPALQAWLPGAWMELRVSPRIVILARDRD